MARIYGVAASRHAIDGDYVSAMQLPMFYLSGGTQGIIDEPHASRIASEIVGEPVTAFDVTADFIAAAAPSLLAENERLRAESETVAKNCNRLNDENNRLRTLLNGVYAGLGRDSRAGDASWRLATLDAIGAGLNRP